MVCGLVWGIGLRRLGCGCGRRLVTGSCVSRETTQTGCPRSRPRVSLSIYLSIPPKLATLPVLEPGHRNHGHRRLLPRLGLAAVLAAWLAAWLAAEAVRRCWRLAVGNCISVVRRAAVGAHADRLLGGDGQHHPTSHDAGRPDPRCCACNGPHFHWPACIGPLACTMAHPALAQLHWPNVRLDLSTGRRRWARSSRQRTRKT